MTKERNAETIEKEMKKSQEIVKKEQNKIRSLNAELTTAKKREKARRYQAVGSAMEKVLGIGELSNDDITTLINCLKVKAYSKDGVLSNIFRKNMDPITSKISREDYLHHSRRDASYPCTSWSPT